jgi:GTP 3',8-cyclase
MGSPYMITDTYNRVHNYLRISLTDNCNLRCFYCMPDESYDFAPVSSLMQKDEIVALSRLFVSLGVTKIRLTGGEPLVRKDAGEIILALSELPVSLTITTNATRLHKYIDVLKASSIRSLNISLDTLDKEKFLIMTRRDQFSDVIQNIQLMLDNGFHVKINVVVMKGLNDHEINDFVAWTKDTNIHIRFIEFMPFNGNRWHSDKVYTLDQILSRIKESYAIEKLNDDFNDTAKKYKVAGHKGTFAVISTMSAPFCSGCNRIRLTAEGKLKNCLFSKSETDILTPYRNGQDIVPLIHKNIMAKAEALGGQFTSNFIDLMPEDIDNRSMITIGG